MERFDLILVGGAIVLLSGMVSWIWEWTYEKFLSIENDLHDLRAIEHRQGILERRHNRLVKLVTNLNQIGLHEACEEYHERRSTPQGNQPAEAADNGDGPGAA